jgi:hypothetical protein
LEAATFNARVETVADKTHVPVSRRIYATAA